MSIGQRLNVRTPFAQWLLIAAVLLLIGSTVGLSLFTEHNSIDAGERQRLVVQAKVINDNLGAQLHATNHALESIRSDLPALTGRADGKELINRRLQAMSDSMLGMRTLQVLDAEGMTIASNRKELIGRDFHEREYFQTARQGRSADMLYVSSPYKTFIGVFAITMAKAVLNVRGEFAGAIAATLEPEYFKTLLESVNYAPDMRSSLIHSEGKVLLTVPDTQGVAGIDLSMKPGAFFAEHVKSGQPTSVFAGVVPTTGDVRLAVFRSMQTVEPPMDKSLVVVVSRQMQSIFAPWRKNVYQDGVMFGILVLISAMGLYFYQRRQQAYDRLLVREEGERKLSEERLRESEQRYRGLFDEANEGLMIMTEDGKLSEVNQAFAVMHGYTQDELRRMDISELDILKNHTIESRAETVRRIQSGEVVRFEVEHLHKDGHVFPLNVTTSMIRLNGRQYYLAFHQDMTERKQAEATRTLLEAQLRESQKMQALGTLAGGVAHDFNNVLAVIAGNAELVRQDVGPEHVALKSLEEIDKASRRAKALVQQILAFGRRQTTERKVMSLEPVVQEAAGFLRSTIPAGLRLNVECAPDAPAVLVDATQIEQVLLNLGGNAWHAIEGQARPGLIEIRLDAEVRGDLRFAALSVCDNGQGMDEATRARIFEPFFTTKPVDKGTGLGLSVVYGIAQAHEAGIEVRSTPGEGTTFVIRFAAAQPSAASAPVKNKYAVDTDAGETLALQLEGKRVLYVDDDESIVSLMTRLLGRRGYRVTGYTDPREAVAAVKAAPDQFDLAVTDYNMPGMSGLEVARALRAIRFDLPIVMASGYITDELRVQAPVAGVNELVFKPNTVDELCDAVERLAQTVREKENAS